MVDDQRARGGRRRPRQVDVARAAGVTQAAVSLALSGRELTGRMSDETRDRILSAANELNYVADPAARSLASGRNRILGVYTFEAGFPSGSYNFYQPFLSGIEAMAEKVGYDLLLFTSASRSGSERGIYAGNENRLALADGCILLGRRENKGEIARLARERFPIVYIGRRDVPDSEFSYVTADYRQATLDTVTSLVELGHRRICFLSRPQQSEPGIARESGWQEAVRRAALTEDEARTIRPEAEDQYAVEIQRLRTECSITALVIDDPVSAPAVFDAIDRLGLQVPTDLSVVVLGDLWGPGTPTRVAGFTIPREEMGGQAVQLLVEEIEHPATAGRSHVMLPCIQQDGPTVADRRSR